MLETMYIGISGLASHARGLRVISNNIANLNTPGFKGGRIQFTDLMYQREQTGAGGNVTHYGSYGVGVSAFSESLNLQAGQTRQTGNQLDLAISGQGFFQFSDEGQVVYSRYGQFEVDAEGFIVTRNNQKRLQGFSGDGRIVDISIAGLRSNAPKATNEVKFIGNLSSSVTEFTLNEVRLKNPLGVEQVLKLEFNKLTAAATEWTVRLLDGTTEIGAGNLKFDAGKPDATASSFSIVVPSAELPSYEVKFDFSGEVTSFQSGSTSTLIISSQNGRDLGGLSNVGFDADGFLSLTYSNGQNVKGDRIALAFFESQESLNQLADAEFSVPNSADLRIGRPKSDIFGSISAGAFEGSNVDLSQEFSDLIIMQRGYQASSRVLTTANQMIQELFDMRNGRG